MNAPVTQEEIEAIREHMESIEPKSVATAALKGQCGTLLRAIAERDESIDLLSDQVEQRNVDLRALRVACDHKQEVLAGVQVVLNQRTAEVAALKRTCDAYFQGAQDWMTRALAAEPMVAELKRTQAPPIDMILHCPVCHSQHIDQPDERTPSWNNPPHKSHLCHSCGCVWRPSEVPTNGVSYISKLGKSDTWPLSRTHTGFHDPMECGICAFGEPLQSKALAVADGASEPKREPAYYVRSFWSPCRKYIVSACVPSPGSDISMVDDDGRQWEPTGPAQDMTALAPPQPLKSCPCGAPAGAICKKIDCKMLGQPTDPAQSAADAVRKGEQL